MPFSARFGLCVPQIGGFNGQPDSELYIRWVQFGIFSPVLRPHTNGKSGFARDVWLHPHPQLVHLRAAFRLRARLVPYLAAAQREAYESGVIPVRPM